MEVRAGGCEFRQPHWVISLAGNPSAGDFLEVVGSFPNKCKSSGKIRLWILMSNRIGEDRKWRLMLFRKPQLLAELNCRTHFRSVILQLQLFNYFKCFFLFSTPDALALALTLALRVRHIITSSTPGGLGGGCSIRSVQACVYLEDSKGSSGAPEIPREMKLSLLRWDHAAGMPPTVPPNHRKDYHQQQQQQRRHVGYDGATEAGRGRGEGPHDHLEREQEEVEGSTADGLSEHQL